MAGTTEGGKKTSEGNRGDPHKASPAAVENYLKGINFPADKNKLITHAQKNNAPDYVMYVLSQFGEEEYHSPVDVAKEIGNINEQ